MNYRTEIAEDLSDQKLFAFILKAKAELMEKHHTGEFNITVKHKAVYVLNTKKTIIGAICLDVYEDSSIFIDTSYVKKSYRRKGLYKKMYSMLEDYAEENKCYSINTCVAPQNKTMLSICDKHPRRERVGIYFTQLIDTESGWQDEDLEDLFGEID